MKKSDLRSGDIIKTRKGNKYIVLLNARSCFSKNIIINLGTGELLQLEDYNDNLICNFDTDCDIIAVCSEEYVGDNLREHGIIKGFRDTNSWTWEREETREISIEEAEKELKKLGYSIKIIKEK